MPSKSKAQNRFMHATAKGQTGIPRKIGKAFVKADTGRKIAKLPDHVKHKPSYMTKHKSK